MKLAKPWSLANFIFTEGGLFKSPFPSVLLIVYLFK